MPSYDYVCQQCAKPFEIRQSMSQHAEGAAPACPECGSRKVARRFTPVAVATGSGTGSRPAPSCDAGGGCCCG